MNSEIWKEKDQALCISLLWCCHCSIFTEISQITLFYTHDSIEKVQLPDMGSYRCAVQSASHRIMSEEGSIQLEGEFISRSRPDVQKENYKTPAHVMYSATESESANSSRRPSSFLRGAPAHVCSGQRVHEPELCGPRTPRAGQGHLAAGRVSSQLPGGPGGPVALHTQSHRYQLSHSTQCHIETV